MQGGTPRGLGRLHFGLRLALCAGLLALTGCPQPSPSANGTPAAPGSNPQALSKPDPRAKRELTVWADPVLIPALTGLAGQYHTASGGGYRLTPVERGALLAWASSGDLAGKPAPDVVLFAGQASFTALRTGQRIDEASARTFAGDRLIVLKPQGSTFISGTVFDLWELRFQHLAVADPQQTALGVFTEQALISDGAKARLKDRTQTYTDTTQLPGLPAKDPSTLALAFMSQSGTAKGVETMLLIDKGLHEPIQYRAAAVTGKTADPAVQALLRWLAENDATQQALGGYGLLSRAVAMGTTVAPPPGSSAPLPTQDTAPAAPGAAAPSAPAAPAAPAAPSGKH